MTSRTPISARRHSAVAALLTAFALLGTACTSGQASPGPAPGSQQQVPTATSSSSPAPTAAPTARYKPADAKGRAQNVPVPVLPEAAKKKTKEGLEAFARYWFSLLSYGYETGDTRGSLSVTSPTIASHVRARKEGHHGVEQPVGDGWLAGVLLITRPISTNFARGPDGNYQVAVQGRSRLLPTYRPGWHLSGRDPQPDDTGNLMFAAFTRGACGS